MRTNGTRLAFLLGLWGAAASVAGVFHLIAHLPRWAGPTLIAGLSLSFSVALWRVNWLRALLDRLSVRAIVVVHIFRFVGVYFLWLQSQGRLPLEFAQRAGWGDIATAFGACVILGLKEGAVFRAAFVVWNIFGALDLLTAVGTAGWLNAIHPGSMREIAGFPLTLIPLWLVPVYLGSHFYLLRRQLTGNFTRDSRPAGVVSST